MSEHANGTPHRKTVTIGFYPRERFAAAAESLRSIVAYTDIPHTLIIVDAATPKNYLMEMEAAVADHPDVRWIRAGRFLTSNESRNRITAAATSDYLCFIENACTVKPHWLASLIEGCERLSAGAATPNIRERSATGDIPHHDYGFVELDVTVNDGGRIKRRCIADNALRRERFASTEPRAVTTSESHCQLFSRETLEALGQFDETLTVGTHVDVTCALLDKGIRTVFVPEAVVVHLPTTSLRDDEKGFFAFRWDVARAQISCTTLVARWNIEGMADFVGFAKGQYFRTNQLLWNAYRLWHLPRSFKERYLRG